MLLSVLTVFAVNILGSGQHREAFATDEHGKSEPEALATVCKEKHLPRNKNGNQSRKRERR